MLTESSSNEIAAAILKVVQKDNVCERFGIVDLAAKIASELREKDGLFDRDAFYVRCGLTHLAMHPETAIARVKRSRRRSGRDTPLGVIR